MSASTAIAVAVLLPLAAAPLIALLGRRPNVRETATLIAALGTFASVCTLCQKSPQVPGQRFIWWRFSQVCP